MKKHNTQFLTLTTTGSIFSSDMLSLITHSSADYQSASDYKLLPGIRFTDQISRSFHIAQALYADFAKEKESDKNPYDVTKQFISNILTMAFDYGEIKNVPNPVIDGTTYPVTMEVSKDVPLVVAPYNFLLNQNDGRFSITNVTTRKKSAFGMTQQFLNASVPCTWAICSNGNELRLVRDSDSLVKPTFVSFDLESILKDERYPDFEAMWYVLHSSRVSVWEKWHQEGVANGSRVRDGLRIGVTEALLNLGTGFLQNSSKQNDALREALSIGKTKDGSVYTAVQFYQELLRLIYRFLFLSTLEERNLLFAHSGEDAKLEDKIRIAHKIYNEGYSIQRLATKAQRATRTDRFSDLWEGVKVVFESLQKGNEKLDLCAMGGLFRKSECPILEECCISNYYLLRAIKNLRWCYIDNTLTFTDYRNMDTEEFGSVYESLLELVPIVKMDAREFTFVGYDDDGSGSTTGNARKLTGSYYTNPSLVHSLIKTALVPAVELKLGKPDSEQKEKALLEMTVVDPACGSGHFLLAAARYIAERLAEVRMEKTATEDETPDSTAIYRTALRDVITNCVYGVDINSMAVELTRTALWIESYEPGKPLEFLAHHIKCGNSLVGVFDEKVLENGIPDAAYTALSGDDKTWCSTMKASNKKAVADRISKQGDLGLFEDFTKEQTDFSEMMDEINTLPSDTIAHIERKRELYEKLISNVEYKKKKTMCNLYTASFFASKKQNELVSTSADIFALKDDLGEQGKTGIREMANKIAEENKFFHWKLEFPEIFEKNLGFDCVLGNPPWDKMTLQEKEYFSNIYPSIAEAEGNKRKKMIEELKNGTDYDKTVYKQYVCDLRKSEATSKFIHSDYDGTRYPLTGFGIVNLYALFAELILNLRGTNGNAGFIVPSGIASDDSTKEYFAHIATKGLLSSLYDFENREKLFPSVDSRFKFSLVTLAQKTGLSRFAFFLHNVDEMEDERRNFSLLPEDFDLINPNTHTCPVFRSNEDMRLTKKIYNNAGTVFVRDEAESDSGEDKAKKNPWGIRFQTIYNMTTHSYLFKTISAPDLLPLYEAKMTHQFDHRWATFEGTSSRDVTETEKADARFSVTPQYWVSKQETVLRTTSLADKIVRQLRCVLENPKDENAKYELRNLCDNYEHSDNELYLAGKEKDVAIAVYRLAEKRAPKYLMGWRDITNATNMRTVISSVVPFAAANHKFLLFKFKPELSNFLRACLLANMNAIPFDFVARQKMGGTDLTYTYLKQFPVLPPHFYKEKDLLFIVPRVFALTYTAYDMEGWASSLWQDASLELRLGILNLVEQLRNPQFSTLNSQFSIGFVDREFSTSFIPPLAYNRDQRALLRAELDVYYAKLYGLSHTDLQYILDPASVMGEDYPSETFRVLKENEIAEYGEYRTQRLVLEAWDKMGW